MEKGEFVKLDYTGKLDDGEVFDTTIEKVAKKNDIYNEETHYHPITICIGEQFVVPGLDKDIEGKNIGKHKVSLKPEEAFGKRNAKLLNLIPLKKFREQNLNPQPGMELNIDGMRGIVKTASGGRVIVDFNHPLAGREVTYEYEILDKVTDKKEQIESLLHLVGISGEVSVKDKVATIKGGLPEQLHKNLKEQIKKLVDVEDVKFEKAE